MKKYYSLSAAMAVLVVFTACNKDLIATTSDDEAAGTIELTINAGSPETKTVFGENSGSGYPITWSETGEAIKLVEFLTPTTGDASYKDYTSTGYTLSNSNSTAVFSASVDELSTEGTYDYRAIYPASVYQSANLKYSDLYVKIPDSQTPTPSSPDAAATVLYAESTGFTAQPTASLDLAFSHITAYGKMTIKNASSAFANPTEEIQSVSISVPAGGIYYYWEDGTIASVAATQKDEVSIKTDNLDTSNDFVAWFACAPYSLDINDILTVSVTTAANTYTRKITMTKAMAFESGKVSKFSVDMSTASAAGDLSGNYLVVSTDGTNPWYAMTYDVSNGFYRGELTGVAASTAIDVNDASTNFSDYCVDAYVWALAKVSGGYTLKNANTGKYVSWSSGNSATAVTTAATLIITDTGSGVFTVKHSSDESRVLQYNYNSGTNPRFAFYTSSQKALTFIPVSSFKQKLASPSIKASSSGSSITVTWDEVDNASSYIVSCSGASDQSVALNVGTYTFDELEDGTHTVSVTAVGDGTTYVNSYPTNMTVVISSVSGTDVVFVVGTDFSSLQAINEGVTKDDITLTCNTTAYYSPLRIYSGNTVKIDASNNKKIIKVVLTGSNDTYIRNWKASDDGSCTISGSTMTWTSSGATSITFTQTESAQARITKFTVTYTD